MMDVYKGSKVFVSPKSLLWLTEATICFDTEEG